MYQIIKVLNNNTILASNGDVEVIVMHKGIGFSKKSDDLLEVPRAAKKYIMQKSSRSKDANEIINQLDPIFLEVASEILKEAHEMFDDVDDGILLPLADHICYAIKRMEDNIMPVNPFVNDIRLLFPKEYEVASSAKDIIAKLVGKVINEDEVGYITIHVHSAISNNAVSESMEATRIIHDSIEKLQDDLHIVIDITSISYVRLMNHIKYLLLRLNRNEQLEMDISEFTKEKFPFAYEYAKQICEDLSKTLNKQLPDNEIGYLALHLERILSSVET